MAATIINCNLLHRATQVRGHTNLGGDGFASTITKTLAVGQIDGVSMLAASATATTSGRIDGQADEYGGEGQ